MLGRWFSWVGVIGEIVQLDGGVGEMVLLVKGLDAHAWYLELDSWYPLKKPDAMVHIYNPNTPTVRWVQRQEKGSSHKQCSDKNKKDPTSKARWKETPESCPLISI